MPKSVCPYLWIFYGSFFTQKVLCMTHKHVDCSVDQKIRSHWPWYSVTSFVQTLLVKWQNFVFTNFGRAPIVHCFAEYHLTHFFFFFLIRTFVLKIRTFIHGILKTILPEYLSLCDRFIWYELYYLYWGLLVQRFWHIYHGIFCNVLAECHN